MRGDISKKRLSEQHQHRKWARPSQGHDPALNRLAACSSGRVALLAVSYTHLNGGYAFFYVSSVSFDAFIAWIVASTIFNSLSSKAFNMASVSYTHLCFELFCLLRRKLRATVQRFVFPKIRIDLLHGGLLGLQMCIRDSTSILLISEKMKMWCG